MPVIHRTQPPPRYENRSKDSALPPDTAWRCCRPRPRSSRRNSAGSVARRRIADQAYWRQPAGRPRSWSSSESTSANAPATPLLASAAPRVCRSRTRGGSWVHVEVRLANTGCGDQQVVPCARQVGADVYNRQLVNGVPPRHYDNHALRSAAGRAGHLERLTGGTEKLLRRFPVQRAHQHMEGAAG